MKKQILLIGSLLIMATIANAQVGKEFQGNYSFESDINLLINKWSKKSNLDSNQTITSTQTITIKTGVSKEEFKSPEEIEKMVNDTINKMVAEAMAKHGAGGEIVSSTNYSKSMVIYDDITVKANSIESSDKATGKNSVMFSFDDKDVEKVSDGYKITTKDGEVITLIRKDKKTLVIPERGLVLKKK
jgi:hypothetical protein